MLMSASEWVKYWQNATVLVRHESYRRFKIGPERSRFCWLLVVEVPDDWRDRYDLMVGQVRYRYAASSMWIKSIDSEATERRGREETIDLAVEAGYVAKDANEKTAQDVIDVKANGGWIAPERRDPTKMCHECKGLM